MPPEELPHNKNPLRVKISYERNVIEKTMPAWSILLEALVSARQGGFIVHPINHGLEEGLLIPTEGCITY